MASGSFDFTPDGVLQGRIVWSSTSKGAISNSSDVTATLYARRTDSYGPTRGQSWSGYVKVGTTQTNISFSSSVAVGDSWVEMAKVSANIGHNSDGSGSATISGSVTGPSGTSLANRTSSGSSTVTLDKIPRYTSITSFSVDKRDETSLTFKWQTANIVDYVWYSTNDGSNWTGYNVSDGTSGSFTVSSLSANTTYNCKIRVRRKDSQLNTDSGRVQQTTYNYPYCTNSPNFTIGNAMYLTLYNPLKRNCRVRMYGDDWSVIFDGDGWTGTSAGPWNTDGIKANLYKSIPNKQSGTYHIKITYNNVDKDRTNAGIYSIRGDEKPTFANFDYDDTNSTTLALTGNSKILVKGYSNNKITVSTTNKATAKNSATMSSYEVKQGNKSAKTNYSSSASVTMSMTAIDNNVITVSAIDSRKLSTSVSKTLNSTYYKEYSALVIKSVTVKRSNNGVGQNVTLAFNGTFWNNSFGSVSNDIASATYQYKETTSSSWNSPTALTVSKSGANFSYSGTINGDLLADGFSVEKSFNIRVIVKDKLSTKTYDIILGAGTPAIAIYKDRVSVGRKYDSNIGKTLQIATSSIAINNTPNTDTFYYALRTDTGTQVAMGVGAGGINHGVYSLTLNKWLLYGDANDVYVNEYKINESSTRGVKTLTTKGDLGWGTNNNYLPDLGMIAFWDGGYNSNHNSNLTYAHEGTIQCKPIELYNNTTGTNGTVMLSQSAANFTYLEIFACLRTSNDGDFYFSEKIYSPNGKKATLTANRYANDDVIQIIAGKLSINGTSITRNGTTFVTSNAGAISAYGALTAVYITRVVGYK